MRIIAALILVAVMMGCKSSETTLPRVNACEGGEVLTLVDLTGLDGCNWVFEQSDGKRLEPINLKDKLPTPTAKDYMVIYKPRTDGASICMVGTMIEIVCISPIN